MVRFLVLVLLVSLFIPTGGFGQGFGKNKVQYKNFDWVVVRTENFDIYLYQGEEELVRFAQQIVEDAYEILRSDLNHTLKSRIPIIIYNSHNDFQQTNVILELIEESVGGFTELYKNRVVVPFTGSYEDFRHVLVHELTHSFGFDLLYGGTVGSVFSRSLRVLNIPLWVFEGLSEFESIGWDENSDMFMRDLVINRNVIPIPELAYVSGYAVYKEGQSIFKFIADKYGRKKIGEILQSIRVSGGLEGAVKSSLGISLRELDDAWMRYLRKNYWPLLSCRQEIVDAARQLTDHVREGGVYNTGPALSPDGDRVAFLSDRGGYADLLVASAIDGRILKRLVKGERSSGFESMHLGRAGISFSPDGQRIAFTAKAGATDRVYVVNSVDGRVEKKLQFDLDGLFSPSFSPDGKRLAFVGLHDGFSDIYTADLREGSLKRLTSDRYDDRDPSWSKDGQAIVFCSDRPDTFDSVWAFGRYAVFFMSDEGENIRRVTERSNFVASPQLVDEGDALLYVSDVSGSKNLHYKPSGESSSSRLTNVLGGIYGISASSSGDRVALCAYRKTGWDIFMLKDLDTLQVQTAEEGKEFAFRDERFNENVALPEKEKVGLSFSPDWATGGFSYSTEYGFAGQTEIAVSDILGNHRIYFASDLFGNILESNFYLMYWYLPRRVDFGGWIFQEKDYYLKYDESTIELLVERTFGASVAASYPLNMFNRVEAHLSGFTIEDRFAVYEPFQEGFVQVGDPNLIYVVTPSISYVHDTAMWGFTGPIDGSRIKVAVARTIPLFKPTLDYASGVADLRKYWKIEKRFSFAVRTVGAASIGRNARDASYWIGGSQTLRGYDDYQFYGTQVAFLNAEFRYPFIDRLKLGFPLPLDFRSVRGAMFVDVGGATNDWRSFRVSKKDDGIFRLQDLKVGFGAGVRMRISFLVFKLDAAKSTDLSDVSRDTRWYFTLGSEF
ncbi:MAG: BamA/TamA family outer membrane protein [bacterium]